MVTKAATEVMVVCPDCGAVETLEVRGERLQRTQRWRQDRRTGRVLHCQRPCVCVKS